MATIAQQLQLLAQINDGCAKALALAAKFQAANVRLDPDNPDTLITLTAAQKQAQKDIYDGYIAAVKTNAAGL